MHLIRRIAQAGLVAWTALLPLLFLGGCAHKTAPKVEQTHPLASLPGLLRQSLERDRVVLLGDAGHGKGYYYHLLTGFLEDWTLVLERLSPDRPRPPKLLLVLESGGEYEKIVQAYLDQGNEDSLFAGLLEHAIRFGGLEQFSVDRLGFYHDLRDLTVRIERLNKTRKYPVEFRVLGLEGDPPNGFQSLSGKGGEEAVRENTDWFVAQRDSIVAGRIEELLRREPEAKVLVYYGTAHLQRGRVDKAEAARSAYPRPGTYLATYLDRALGRKNVGVFFTRPNPFPNQPDCIHRMSPGKDSPDYEILAGPYPPFPVPVLMLRTRRVLDWLADAFDRYRMLPDSTDQRWAYRLQYVLNTQLHRSYLTGDAQARPAIDVLRHIGMRKLAALRNGRGGDPNREDDLFSSTARRLIARFDAVENIRHLEQWADSLPTSTYLSVNNLIRNLPGAFPPSSLPPTVETTPANTDKANWGAHPAETKKSLMEYLALNLLAIGTPEEKSRAMGLLHELTGQDFRTTEEWSGWWKLRHTRPGSSLMKADSTQKDSSILEQAPRLRPATFSPGVSYAVGEGAAVDLGAGTARWVTAGMPPKGDGRRWRDEKLPVD